MKSMFLKSAGILTPMVVVIFAAVLFMHAVGVSAAERLPMIRMYNPAINDHFYTSNRIEADEAAAKHGYRLEGEMGYMYRYEQANTEPVYRMWNPKAGKHFYTTSLDENRNALNSGFLQEGILGFVPNQYSGGGEVGLLRLYSPAEQKHFYTTSIAERDMLVGKGYKWEGYLGYGLFAGDVELSGESIEAVEPLQISAELGLQAKWPFSFRYTGEETSLNWSTSGMPTTMYLENNGPVTLYNNGVFTLMFGGSVDNPASSETFALTLSTGKGYSKTFQVQYSTVGGTPPVALFKLYPDLNSANSALFEEAANVWAWQQAGQITQEQARVYFLTLTASANPEVSFVAQKLYNKLQNITSPYVSITVPFTVYTGYYPVKLYSVSGDVADPKSFFNIDENCMVLKLRLNLECSYEGSLDVDVQKMLISGTQNQYDADMFITELQNLVPSTVRQTSLVIVYFSKDLKPSSLNYVVSFQSPSENVGVVSSFRLKQDFPDLFESEVVGRRLMLKTLGTAISLLDYGRPNYAVCPNYYFSSVEEFTLQRSAVCGSNQDLHDDAVEQYVKRSVSSEENLELSTLYTKYLMREY